MTIVVGYIPSPQGEAALERALAEAKTNAQDLVVVNSSSDAKLIDDHRVYDDDVSDLEARLDASGVDYTLRRVVANREPADEILEAAKEADASAIVIGIRRRSAVGKLVFGSTAQRVLMDAECEVIAVKPLKA